MATVALMRPAVVLAAGSGREEEGGKRTALHLLGELSEQARLQRLPGPARGRRGAGMLCRDVLLAEGQQVIHAREPRHRARLHATAMHLSHDMGT